MFIQAVSASLPHVPAVSLVLVLAARLVPLSPPFTPRLFRRAAATTPRTMSDEWREATVKMDLAKERVAGEPVEVNPIRHAAKKKL